MDAVPNPTRPEPPDYFAELLERSGPRSERYEIIIEGTEIFEFKYFNSATEMRELKAKISDFTEAWEGGRMPPALKPYAGSEMEPYFLAYLDEAHTRRFIVHYDVVELTAESGEIVRRDDGTAITTEVERREEVPRFGPLGWLAMHDRWAKALEVVRGGIEAKSGVNVQVRESEAFNRVSKS